MAIHCLCLKNDTGTRKFIWLLNQGAPKILIRIEADETAEIRALPQRPRVLDFAMGPKRYTIT